MRTALLTDRQFLGVLHLRPQLEALFGSVLDTAVYQQAVDAVSYVADAQQPITYITHPDFLPKVAQASLALCLQESGYKPDQQQELPHFSQTFSVKECSNNYAAAYVDLWYHPHEPQALQKKQLLAEIADFCAYEKTPLLVAVRLYNPSGGVLPDVDFQEAQLQTVQELFRSATVLGLEYPGSALAAVTISADTDVPWVMVNHHLPEVEPYDLFKNHLRECLEAGARGGVIGHALWSGLASVQSAGAVIEWPRFEQALNTTITDRLIELRRVLDAVKVLQ